MDLLTPDFGLVFWQTITLLLVIFILGKFAWKPILRIIQEREDNVSNSLIAADEARKMLAQLQHDKENLLKTAAEERNKIVTEALKIKNEILEEAKDEAEKATRQAVENARKILHAERLAATEILKKDMVSLSLSFAEKILDAELSKKQEQERLVHKLMSEVNFS
jgi:F-type H+-transporting ATPase subunit b